MKTRHILSILSVLLMVFVTLAAAGPAYANTHTKEVYSVNSTNQLIPGNKDSPSPCDFALTEHLYGTLRINKWFDGDVLTHEIDIYGNIKDDYYVNGKSVNLQFQGPGHLYYEGNKVITKATGEGLAFTIPGYGKVTGGGGQIIMTFTIDPITGDWTFVSVDKYVGSIMTYIDWAPVCAYLAS